MSVGTTVTLIPSVIAAAYWYLENTSQPSSLDCKLPAPSEQRSAFIFKKVQERIVGRNTNIEPVKNKTGTLAHYADTE